MTVVEKTGINMSFTKLTYGELKEILNGLGVTDETTITIGNQPVAGMSYNAETGVINLQRTNKILVPKCVQKIKEI